jgi:hypothetical protein
MTHEKGVEDVPVIWQDHERRITTLEVNMSGLSKQMDGIDKKVESGNKEQKDKLDIIDKRLLDEFFYKKRSNHDNKWKLVGKITAGLFGVGGILYMLFDLVISRLL